MAILKKIRSRKGASITFALLAFLVCAVVGSVVLTAALASSGRASELAESDRRYYAVTSAAQLFQDSLDGQEFRVDRVNEYSSEKQTKYFTDETKDPQVLGEDLNPSNTYSVKILVDGAAEPAVTVTKDTKKISLLTEAALCYVIGDDIQADTYDPELPAQLGAIFASSVGNSAGWSMILDSADYPSLKVVVDAEMSEDGTIVFTFKNADVTGDPFRVTMTMLAGVRDNSTAPNVAVSDVASVQKDEAHTDPEYYIETVRTTTTTTKSTWIKWTVSDVKKVNS